MFKNLIFKNKTVTEIERGSKDVPKLSSKYNFDNIINFAKEILESNVSKDAKQHPIFDVIRILGRGLQTDYMKYLLYIDGDEDNSVHGLSWSSVGFQERACISNNQGKYLNIHDLKEEVKCKKKINLSTDLILPWPWHKDRLIRALIDIGEGRKKKKWKQDFNNHFVEVWLPMGIAWVNGGNHSITMGIVQGGELEPEYYYDISDVYKYVYCDGENFIRTEDNKVIAKVTNVEFAAIFEIGRLLVEKGLSFID
ncbi:hypothetical protein AXY43_26465 [Clostridium sp. MF28]|uniref:DUF6710 family protein n=2 Tax=Clostridium TaxID=1485 RepID=UPI000CFA2A0C|nr:DUF6710 family protein [Clostridium diolis]AVK51271.1 hypothetical protein AXY43_26465 [Clostridium sp. MF28]PSM59373.1 hypothetical protein C4L39_03420 [Clostridium diolis]